MKQTLTLALALAAGLAAAAHAQTAGRTAEGTCSAIRAVDRTHGAGSSTLLAQNQPAAGGVTEIQAIPRLPEGTPVVLVGEITSSPKAIIREHRMQVAVSPARMTYTLHLSGATVYDAHGAVIKPHRLADKMWVRAEGTVMTDPWRIKAKQVQVIGKDMSSLQQSAFYRPGFEHGYLMAIAGSRQTYPEVPGVAITPPPLTVIGKVVQDTEPFEATRKIRVEAAGNIWTLEVPKDTPVFDVQGRKISVHHIAKGQWIRAHGWQTDDLTVRVARLQEIGLQEAYRASVFYRPGEPVGYVERAPGPEVRFIPIRMTGVITALDLAAGTVTLRDDTGEERVLPLASATIRADGREVDVARLQPGQRVTVAVTEIVFQQ
jgi:hypothetical protein